jgi:hypothetical protein
MLAHITQLAAPLDAMVVCVCYVMAHACACFEGLLSNGPVAEAIKAQAMPVSPKGAYASLVQCVGL